MATIDEIKLERLKREKARRQGGGAPAPAAAPQGGDDGLLYKIPGVGPYLQSFDQGLQGIVGRPPNAQEGLQGLDDAARIIADTATRGYLDQSLGPEAVAKTQAAQKRLGPGASTAISLGESVVEPTLTSKIKLIEQGGKLVKAGGRAVEGGIDTAATAYGHGAPLTELPGEFAKGAGISGALSQIAAPVSKWWQRRQNVKNQTFKNADDLEQGRKNKYKVVDSSGAVFTERDLRQLGAQIQNMKLVPGVDDRLIAFRNRLKTDWSGKNISPEDLDLVRQDIRELPLRSEKTGREGRITQKWVSGMDKFTKKTPVYTPPPKGQAGPLAPAPSVNKELLEGRDLFAREQRLKMVEDAQREAARDVTRSRFNPFGTSPESADVKRFSDIARKADKGKLGGSKFTDEELARIRDLESGGGAMSLRNLGGKAEKFSLSGGWAPWVVGAVTGGASLPFSIGAEIVHQLGRRDTGRKVEELKAMIRDPTGRGIAPDPGIVETAKDRLAKLMTTGYRTRSRKDGGPR